MHLYALNQRECFHEFRGRMVRLMETNCRADRQCDAQRVTILAKQTYFRTHKV